MQRSLCLLSLLFWASLLLSACQPTYSSQDLIIHIPREIKDDWGIQIDDVRMENGHLGIVFKTANLWAEDGALTQSAKDEIANTGRTIERVLASSDADVERLSVMTTSADSTLNVYFERDYAEIRKKRVGAVAWQNIINTDLYDTVPAWRWEAFDRDYAYYQEQDPTRLAEILQDKIRAQTKLDVTVSIADRTLGILIRVARMREGELLNPEAEARVNALLSEGGLFAMKSVYPLDVVTVTIMGSDSDTNVYRTDRSSNSRARVLEEIDQLTHLARIEQGTTPFWEWKEFGVVNLYTDENMLALIQQEGSSQLESVPNLTLEGDRLTILIDFPTAELPLPISFLQNDNVLKFLARAERILLLGTTKPAMLQLSFRAMSGKVSCLQRNMQDAIDHVLGNLTTVEYLDHIAIAEDDTCLPTPIIDTAP